MLFIVSCKQERQPSFDEMLVNSIIENDSDSNLIVLNIKQGQFQPASSNDTLQVYINGFEFIQMYNVPDSTKHSAFTENIENFCFQGFWDSDILKTRDITLEDLIFIDTLPNLEIDSLFLFNWDIFPGEVNGLTSFSKPLIYEKNKGLIAQMVYTRDNMLHIKLFSFNTMDDSISYQLGNCISFKLLGFYIEYDQNKIRKVDPSAIVYMGHCRN